VIITGETLYLMVVSKLLAQKHPIDFKKELDINEP